MKKLVALTLLTPLALLTCARGPELPTAATRVAPPESLDGGVSTSAIGDVKTGPGDLEIFNVRMDRQNALTGESILRQYADPGETYRIEPGERIELWVEYRGVANPRVRVDWGEGEIDRFDGHVCGGCLFYHTYPIPGVFTVVVTVDDEAGTIVRRTFVLNSLPLDAPPAVLGVAVTGSWCSLPHLTGPGGIDCTPTGGTCSATFPAGTTVTLDFSAVAVASAEVSASVLSCTVFNGWIGACAGIGTGAGNSASCTLTLPSGMTTTTLQTTNSD